jgi:hypothetical protein
LNKPYRKDELAPALRSALGNARNGHPRRASPEGHAYRSGLGLAERVGAFEREHVGSAGGPRAGAPQDISTTSISSRVLNGLRRQRVAPRSHTILRKSGTGHEAWRNALLVYAVVLMLF